MIVMFPRRPIKRSQAAFRRSGGLGAPPPGVSSGSAGQLGQRPSDIPRQTIERDSSKRRRVELDAIDQDQDQDDDHEDFGGADDGWDTYTNLTLVNQRRIPSIIIE